MNNLALFKGSLLSFSSEWLIKRTADAMANKGYINAGYEYVVIDDCWLANTRDGNMNLMANSSRFPSGILDLSRYVSRYILKKLTNSLINNIKYTMLHISWSNSAYYTLRQLFE